jgi:hypothetical protein
MNYVIAYCSPHFYNTTPSAMKTWPYKRDGASLERDNLVVFY